MSLKRSFFLSMCIFLGACVSKSQNVVTNEDTTQYKFEEIRGKTVVCIIHEDESSTFATEDTASYQFTEVPGSTIVVNETLIQGFNQVLKPTIFSLNKDKDDLFLLGKNSQLHSIPYYSDETSFLKHFIVVRLDEVPTSILGFSVNTGKFFLNIDGDTISSFRVPRLLAEFLKPYDADQAFSETAILSIGYEWVIDKIKSHPKLRSEICRDTYNKINQICPAECVAFSPISGAVIIKSNSKNFLPYWKENLIEHYIDVETKGEFNLSSLDRMSESEKQRMHDKLMKTIDRYISE